MKLKIMLSQYLLMTLPNTAFEAVLDKGLEAAENVNEKIKLHQIFQIIESKAIFV